MKELTEGGALAAPSQPDGVELAAEMERRAETNEVAAVELLTEGERGGDAQAETGGDGALDGGGAA